MNFKKKNHITLKGVYIRSFIGRKQFGVFFFVFKPVDRVRPVVHYVYNLMLG